ncbi:lipase family protein [Vibrio superstes]|uniref:Lipase n=1 Tax=Vibrio superstes NBRC 103154 TaxID=1219062 RepID=A0A511QQB6_9VIBR|nr:lipase [Vibrio superstes]GEM79539.1 lipase [Vibrio superstes NBRC 103154]
MKSLKRYQYERYAVLCRLAYPRVFKQTAFGFDPNGQRIIRNAQGNIMMRVLWNKQREEVVLVIKGSHSVKDWLLNLGFWHKSCKNFGLDYSIHAGFHYLLSQESPPSHRDDQLGLSVFERVLAIIEPRLKHGYRLVITGHSSGGAIGSVIGDYVEHHYPKAIKRIVTFGQPAVGCWRFKKHYRLAHKTYRVCCDLDIVTFMPLIPLAYWHVGKLLWLYNGRIYENTPTFIRLGRSLISWLIRPFSYHLMSKYIRNKDFFDEH